MYIWQREAWPNFRWDAQHLLPRITDARFRQGRLLGMMRNIGFDLRLESELAATAEDVIKTSAIEGEVLNPASIRSSIARRLGLPDTSTVTTDRKVEGVVEMILDATRNFDRPLTPERLFGWHAALFPTGYSGMEKIDVGAWRTDREDPIRVVSGGFSHNPTVHYQAPPASRMAADMEAYVAWFNDGRSQLDGLLRAGLAHFWFVSIHPMDDGNGRIARAIADLAVAQTERIGQRLYSMSGQIERDKKAYYDILERTQKGDLDVTEWLSWFTDGYVRAIDAAEAVSEKVVNRAKFWQAHAAQPPFNDRQQKILGRLLKDYDGHVTARKWASACGVSMDTAQRDIADLVERGILARNPGGSKSTSYTFTWPSRSDQNTATVPHNGQR